MWKSKLFIIFDQMGKKSLITQARIIDTAMDLFLEKGYDGVKMQELADRAGVNKGLLHHYFNNKQTLFNTIFSEAFDQLFGKIGSILSATGTLEEKINAIIDSYFDLLLANPRLPVFVLFELNRNPAYLEKMFTSERLPLFIRGLQRGNSHITRQKAIHIILTIVSLSVFPFMARPIVMKMTRGEAGFVRLINERRPLVKTVVKNLIKVV